MLQITSKTAFDQFSSMFQLLIDANQLENKVYSLDWQNPDSFDPEGVFIFLPVSKSACN